MLFFVCSRRRRHTICLSDWSSDVCSSDLEDPYAVLGVKREATQEEIRSAYRQLAKKLHPDLNPGDKQAEDKFKQVAGAYDEIGRASCRERVVCEVVDVCRIRAHVLAYCG